MGTGSLEGKGSIGHILGFLPKRLQLNRNILDLLFRLAILFKNFHEKQFQNIFNQNTGRMATRKTNFAIWQLEIRMASKAFEPKDAEEILTSNCKF